jgi:hypothetical protein
VSVREQDTLAAALAAGFAVERLRALGWAALNAAALPTLVLWISGAVPVHAALVWLAAATWPACAAVALACAATESHFRRACESALPAARTVARVSFSSAGHPSNAAVLVTLAGASSAFIWLAAVAPESVPRGALGLARAAWPVLVAATVTRRWRALRT